MRKVKIGRIYKHFKGGIYMPVTVCKHSETMEELVVYKDCEADKIWARPIGDFLGEVDSDKYPEVTQKYRFEEIKH